MDRKLKRISFTVVNDLSYDQRMQRICSTLAEAGYEVTLLGRRLPGSKPLPGFSFGTRRLRLLFKKGKLFYLELQIRYLLYLLFHPVDIYGAVDLDTLLPNVWAARLRRKKLVYDAHEYFTEVPEVIRRPGIKKVWEKVADYGIPKCDLAYTVGPELAAILEKRYGIPFGCVRNVPYRRPVTEINEPKDPLILYQGALNEGRCLEQLMEAVQDLPVNVWIAGEGDLSQSLREKAGSLGLNEKVRFLGYLSPDELSALTPKAWLGFNVLENKGLSYYYSLANKCFDYLQAGVPSLQSPFPEYRKLAKEYPAFIFADPDANSINDTIRVLLDNPSGYTRMQEACLKAAETLNWEEEKKQLYKLYAQLG